MQEPCPDQGLPLARTSDKGAHSPPPPTLEETSGRRVCHESPGHTLPMTKMQSSEDMAAGLAYSDEDYEEDIIEPRALNEITTMTDKTSPWSSFVSDTSEIIGSPPDVVQRKDPSCPSPEPCSKEEQKVRSNSTCHPASLRPPPYESKARVGDHTSCLTSSGAQRSSTCRGWNSPRSAEDKEPMPEAQVENATASSELSDSFDSFEKLPRLASLPERKNHQGSPINNSDVKQKPATSGAEVSTLHNLLYPLMFPTNSTLLPIGTLKASA